MDLCNESRSAVQSAGWPAILLTKTLTLDITPLVSTILYCFHWPWGPEALRVTRSAQSKANWLHFLPHFSSDQDEIYVVMKLLKLNIVTLHWVDLLKQGKKPAVLLTKSKTLMLACISVFIINVIRTWYDGRYYYTLHFDTNLIDLDLESKSQKWESK